MPWTYRVIEATDGTWTCRHGLSEFDNHAREDEALDHIRYLAAGADCLDIRLHRADGTMEVVVADLKIDASASRTI